MSPGNAGRRTGATTPAAGRDIQSLVVRIAFRVTLVVFATGAGILLAWRLRLILLLIAVAMFIALLLQPFVAALEHRGLKRTSAVGVVYLVLVVIGAAFSYIVFHPVVTSTTHFVADLPGLVKQAQHGRGPVGRIVARLHLANYVSQHAPALKSAVTKLGKPALAVGKTVLSGVAGLVTIAFLSFFLLLEGPKVANGVLAWWSEEHAEFARRVIRRMTSQVSGFMLGDFATSIVAGVVVFIALRTTGVPFASVLAIWAGFVDFLPLVGGLLAGVPAVGVAFLHSVPAGVVTIVVFLVYQQIENHILYPLIISRTVQLNSLLVLLAVLLGAEVGSIVGSSFGAICGAIFAVPAAGVIQLTSIELLAQRRARQVADGADD